MREALLAHAPVALQWKRMTTAIIGTLAIPILFLAQMEGTDGMGMCPGCGSGGWVLMIVGALFLLAATAALVALTAFLLRRNPRRV